MANPFEYLARQACKKLEIDNSLTIIQKIEMFDEIQRDCLFASNRVSDFFAWKESLVSFQDDFPKFSYNRKQSSLAYLEDVFYSLDFSKIQKIKNLKFKQRKVNPFYKIYFQSLNPINDMEILFKHMFLNEIKLTFLSELTEKGIFDYPISIPFYSTFYDLEIRRSSFVGDVQFSLNQSSIELPFLYYPHN